MGYNENSQTPRPNTPPYPYKESSWMPAHITQSIYAFVGYNRHDPEVAINVAREKANLWLADHQWRAPDHKLAYDIISRMWFVNETYIYIIELIGPDQTYPYESR
jgi:hypothetical protein